MLHRSGLETRNECKVADIVATTIEKMGFERKAWKMGCTAGEATDKIKKANTFRGMSLSMKK